jgi:hypothetical protein
MAFLQDLSPDDVDEAVRLLAERNLEVALSHKRQNRWVAFRTRVIVEHEGHLWVALPGGQGEAFSPGGRVTLAVNVSHRKYVFTARVDGCETYRLEDDVESVALRLSCPEAMSRLERRQQLRLPLSGEPVRRATFWLGGPGAQPTGGDEARPYWSGRILDISLGGLLLRTARDATQFIDVGDIVGVQLVLGSEDETVTLAAQLRHHQPDGEMNLVGFQFVGLGRTPESRAAIELIRREIIETELAGR